MTYLIVLIIILYGVYSFDIRHKIDYKDRFYYFILIILILISGLSYRMGGDGIGYMLEYSYYKTGELFNWEELNSYISRQPGWVFLTKLCRLFTEDYWLFKMVVAILYNTMVLYGLKRLTSHRFTAILFYFVLIYFDTNFQILRQALAMGLFLVAIPSYLNKKWIRYYLLIALAIAFHEAAIVCLPFPLIRYLKINRTSILIIAGIFLSIIVYIGPLLEMMLTFYIPEAFQDKLLLYAKEIDVDSAFSSYINVFLSFIIPLIAVYLRRNHVTEDIIGKGAIVYGLLYTIGLFFKIFYRFNYFFIFFFFLLYIDIFYEISTKGVYFWKRKYQHAKRIVWTNTRFLTYITLIFIFLSIRSRMYFSNYGETGMPAWVQYYPYSSIIFKDTDNTREQFIHRL